MIADFTPASTDSDQACGSLKWRVVMPSFATAPIEGSASPRKPSVRMRKRSSSSSLEVAWRSTERKVAMGHAAAVVGDADPPPPAAIGENVDPAGAGVDGVFDQFLHNARGTFDHL